jgi:hypothetical protein
MVTSNDHAEATGALNREDSQPDRHAPGGVTGTRRRPEGEGAAWMRWDPDGGRRAGGWEIRGAGVSRLMVPEAGMSPEVPAAGGRPRFVLPAVEGWM